MQQLDCAVRTMHQCTVFLKEQLSSVMCFIASTFVEIVRYPINTVHWLSLRLDEEQLPSFTQRPTPCQTWLTYSMWITDSRIQVIQSIVLTVKGGSAVTSQHSTGGPTCHDFPRFVIVSEKSRPEVGDRWLWSSKYGDFLGKKTP